MVPIDALARGGNGIEGFIYLGLAFLALVIWFNLWSYLLSFPVYIFNFLFRLFGKNVRDGLLTFGVSGFWITYGFPLIYILKTYPNLEWYFHFSLSALIGLAFWFLVIYYMNSKEDSWRSKDK
jgi:hypothetical protein